MNTKYCLVKLVSANKNDGEMDDLRKKWIPDFNYSKNIS